MKLSELVSGLDYEVLNGNIDIEILDIAYDSRKVKKGHLFVCIKGYKTDGHEYIESAVDNQVSAIIVQKDMKIKNIAIPVIKIDDTRYALAYIASKFYENPSEKFNLIGVTGTKGKTTTTFMIKSILEAKGQFVGLIGTIVNKIGNEIIPTDRTTPESYDLQGLFKDMVEKNVDSVAMEVSSHALDLHRVSCSNYDIGIFMNLSRDHMDFHKTFENYFEAKLKLFNMSKVAFVNVDCQYGKKVAESATNKVYTFAVDNKDADITVDKVKMNPDCVEFYVKTPWGNDNIKVGIPGKFSIYNALAAIGTCLYSGIGFKEIKNGLEIVKVPGRAELVETGHDFTIMIDYAHSPDSLENILKTVKGYVKGRVVCVFGCGGDRDKTKRAIMGEISGDLADFTVLTSDNPRTEEPVEIMNDIEQGLIKTGANYIKIVDRKEAIKYAIKNAKKDDVIILAGKGHETYQIFKDKTINFDETVIVKEILSTL